MNDLSSEESPLLLRKKSSLRENEPEPPPKVNNNRLIPKTILLIVVLVLLAGMVVLGPVGCCNLGEHPKPFLDDDSFYQTWHGRHQRHFSYNNASNSTQLANQTIKKLLPPEPHLRVAFTGNGFVSANDLPRLVEALSQGSVRQSSCLRQDSGLDDLMDNGNGMLPKFRSPASVLGTTKQDHHTIYDYGACTVEQLLTGRSLRYYREARPRDRDNRDPCVEDELYAEYANRYFAELFNQTHASRNSNKRTTTWDYVVLTDWGSNAALARSRHDSTRSLRQDYAPLIRDSGATPVIVWNYAYPALSDREELAVGLSNFANFTSLIGSGIKQYANELQDSLDSSQAPKIAPIGPAFLTVYVENRSVWRKLFDQWTGVYPTRHGTFLQALVLLGTLYDGQLPDHDWLIRKDMDEFWQDARYMLEQDDDAVSTLTTEDASYLYSVAQRITAGDMPATLIDYRHGEAAHERSSHKRSTTITYTIEGRSHNGRQ